MVVQCPACFNEIPQDRVFDSIVVCPSCGHTQRPKESAWKENNRGYFFYLTICALVGAFIVSGFILQHRWGNQTIEAVPSQVRLWMDSATAADYDLLSKISLRLQRGDESLVYLKKKAELMPNDLQVTEELASRLYKMELWSEAAPVFYKYISSGGASTQSLYYYAVILSKLNQVDESTKLFKRIMKSKPGVFQITVAKAYVNHLIHHGQTKAAIRAIRSIQKMGSNTKRFMEASLRDLRRGRRG